MDTREKQEIILEIRAKRENRKQRKRRKRIVSLISAGAVLVMTVGIFFTASAKDVRITEIDEFNEMNETKTVRIFGGGSVGEVLDRHNVVINDTDKLNLDVNEKVDDGTGIIVTRGKEITIVADGIEQSAVVTKADAVDALVEAGHIPGENDEIILDNGDDLKSSDKIELISVSSETEVQNEVVEQGVEYVDDDTLTEGETRVIDEGQAGNREIVSNVTYRAGEESEREIISDSMTVEAKNKVVAVGTKKKPSPSAAPAAASSAASSAFAGASDEGGTINGMSYSRKITMTATAYSTHPSENGGYSVSAMGNPLGYGIVAVDPSVIPLGSTVYVTSADGSWTYGIASAEDTGGAVKGNKIDLCYDNLDSSFGRRSCVVYVLE